VVKRTAAAERPAQSVDADFLRSQVQMMDSPLTAQVM
jgi:hypothetical protein